MPKYVGQDQCASLLEGPEGARRAGHPVRGREGTARRSQRDALEKLSGQRQYPVIELEDGTVYREESKDMAARIRRGELLEGQAPVG
jgi:hypothetical protein